MWFEIAYGTILLGNFVYHRYIEDHPRPKPVGALDMQIPRTDEVAPVPLIYGTCRIRSPILTWLGNYHPIDLDDIGIGDPEVPGFQYQIDMLFILGIPFLGGTADSLIMYAADMAIFFDIDLGDGSTPYSHPTADHFNVHTGTSSILIDIYGGYGRGGGLGHKVEFWPGQADQLMTLIGGDGQYSFVEKRMGIAGFANTDIPSYRRQVAVLLHEWSVGEAPNVTGYSFACRSLSTGTASDMGHSLTDDACPSSVLFDLMTSSWGKLGLTSAQMDIPSFQTASTTLFGESHGYSRAIEHIEDATEVIGDVLRQTDGLIYPEPTTGKVVYRLIRLDYDPNNLDDINPDNCETPGSGWFSAQGWSETYNQVRVTFTDRAAQYNDGVIIAQNMANIVAQGRIRNLDVRFPGCCTRALAQKLASRELAVVSRPVTKATVVVNRSFYQTRPGDAVTLTWPKLGIDRMIMRVVRVNFGQLHAGHIKLDLMRDVFDVGLGAFPSP